MAGFKTHITTSSVLGVAYGATAAVSFDVPLPSCLLAGGLCGVSGMLPDLDSGPGVPLRESVAFAAAVVPMLMLHRFRRMGMEPETMVLCGALIYLLIRFGVGRLLRSVTVHRGMFHSIPALAIVGQLAYLICSHENEWIRLFYVGAVLLGFASHLVHRLQPLPFKELLRHGDQVLGRLLVVQSGGLRQRHHPDDDHRAGSRTRSGPHAGAQERYDRHATARS
jgi:hypothetical protein